jgi:group I intron endonuclease
MKKIDLHPVALDYRRKQSGIYCIRNTINGKFYIGSSAQCYHRVKSQHLARLRNNKHSNPHLQASWNVYGEEAFEYFIVEECDRSELLTREQFYLDHSGCTKREIGYNINVLADRTVLTLEQCQKISASKKGILHSEETKMKISESGRGRKWTEEQRAKFIIANSGDNHWMAKNEEQRAKFIIANSGDNHWRRREQ